MTRQEQVDYLQAIQTGYMVAIARNTNDDDALNAWQRLTQSNTALAVLQQCTTRITLKGANNGR